MFCGKCGTKINDGDSFCTNCGANIEIVNENDNTLSLLRQIKSAKIITEYSEHDTIDKIEKVKFGNYPQSDISGNMKEPIEWIVLEKQNDKALLLSSYILDCKCFNDKSNDITWENSDLRKWLNTEFYIKAFNKSEQDSIKITSVANKDNIDYKTSGGNDTEDKLFILSVDESYKYFDKPLEPYKYNFREATRATDYAKLIDKENKRNLLVYSRGILSSDWYKFNSPFWLSTPGQTQTKNAYIGVEGRLNIFGNDCSSAEFGVRPAMWVKI